jgi:hypothetical protein
VPVAMACSWDGFGRLSGHFADRGRFCDLICNHFPEVISGHGRLEEEILRERSVEIRRFPLTLPLSRTMLAQL